MADKEVLERMLSMLPEEFQDIYTLRDLRICVPTETI